MEAIVIGLPITHFNTDISIYWIYISPYPCRTPFLKQYKKNNNNERKKKLLTKENSNNIFIITSNTSTLFDFVIVTRSTNDDQVWFS